MKVIFLDIDGVLNSRKYDRQRNWNEQTDIDETRLPLLKQITDSTGAEIVLSSTWRVHWDKDESLCDEDGAYINATFNKYGLKIYDKTPCLGICAERRDEISLWLKTAVAKEKVVEKFVIIDDYGFGWKDFTENLVKTSPHFGAGLEEEHVEKAIKILNG